VKVRGGLRQEVHTRGYATYVGVVRHVVSVDPCNPAMVAIMKEGGCNDSNNVIHE
jgi:hypothetical protein